jgi:hypothetical protein
MQYLSKLVARMYYTSKNVGRMQYRGKQAERMQYKASKLQECTVSKLKKASRQNFTGKSAEECNKQESR